MKNLYFLRSIEITKYASYDSFTDFKNAVIPDLPTNKTVVILDFVNNTSNTRAAIGWGSVKMPSWPSAYSSGGRVGGQFGGTYGCDVYAGCIINVYVGEL